MTTQKNQVDNIAKKIYFKKVLDKHIPEIRELKKQVPEKEEPQAHYSSVPKELSSGCNDRPSSNNTPKNEYCEALDKVGKDMYDKFKHGTPKIKTWTTQDIVNKYYAYNTKLKSWVIEEYSKEFISKEDLKKVLDELEKEEDNSNYTDDPQVDADISSAVYRTLKELRRRLDLI